MKQQSVYYYTCRSIVPNVFYVIQFWTLIKLIPCSARGNVTIYQPKSIIIKYHKYLKFISTKTITILIHVSTKLA